MTSLLTCERPRNSEALQIDLPRTRNVPACLHEHRHSHAAGMTRAYCYEFLR